MKQIAVYWCKSITEATDKSNLYYIASPTARRIENDHAVREIRIFAKKPQPIAVFRY